MVRITHTGRTLLRYRNELADQADEAAQPFIRYLSALDAKWLAEIRKGGENGVTRKDINALRGVMTEDALRSLHATASFIGAEAASAALNGLKTQAAYIAKSLGIDSWDGLPYDWVKQVFLTMEEQIRTNGIMALASKGIDPNEYLALHGERLNATMRGIEDQLVKSALRRDTWVETARALTDDLGNLQISGRMGAEDFAHGFTRATFTRIANDASTAAAQEAGLDLFFNLGVPDDRQSDECAEADTLGSITLDEWDATDVGQPPRHVLNCRCVLIADVSALVERGGEIMAESAA